VGKLFKLLVLLAFVGGLIYAGSYFGARATVGKMVGGKNPDMGEYSIRFAWKGLAAVRGRPRGWEVTYARSRLNDNRPARIFISPTGRVLGMIPQDLDLKLDSAAAANDLGR
jgi:hypothetical protein